MATKTVIVCDLCGQDKPGTSWENQHSRIKLTCPEDGINGGHWEIDVCCKCRRELYNTIDAAMCNIKNRTKPL